MLVNQENIDNLKTNAVGGPGDAGSKNFNNNYKMWPLHVSICPRSQAICPFSRGAMEEKVPQFQLPDFYLEKRWVSFSVLR